MNNLTKILVFISLFTMVIMFTNAVSASNCTINPKDSIQSFINNTPDNDAIQNNITDIPISDELIVNTTGIVMSNTTSNCGPASLATVLQNLSINVSQDVLAADAGTDENGTTIYGLAQAAQKEGLFAYGKNLSVDQLESGDIVYLNIGEGHYSVITNITNKTVYLADPNIGNINIPMAYFKADYSGKALVISNNSNDKQLTSGTILTNDEMQKIKGMRYNIDWPRTGLKILGCAGIGAGIATGNPGLIFAGAVTVYGAQWG